MKELCEYGDEVARALAIKAPVVALETTVVTHGLPHPDGVTTALSLEQIVREAGATPATIGIIGGAIRIGLTRTEMEQLATTPNVAKINLSNLAAAVSSGQPGSTTVAATMFAAHASAIRVFATGGIGGVHRDASESGDISADLTALSRIPVAVVSAGAKAILDLPRTVEMLETLGVPVFGFETDEFPAFYRRSSGLPVDRRYDSITELASAVRTAPVAWSWHGRAHCESHSDCRRDAVGALRARASHGAVGGRDAPHPGPRGDSLPARPHARGDRRRERAGKRGAAASQCAGGRRPRGSGRMRGSDKVSMKAFVAAAVLVGPTLIGAQQQTSNPRSGWPCGARLDTSVLSGRRRIRRSPAAARPRRDR